MRKQATQFKSPDGPKSRIISVPREGHAPALLLEVLAEFKTVGLGGVTVKEDFFEIRTLASELLCKMIVNYINQNQ